MSTFFAGGVVIIAMFMLAALVLWLADRIRFRAPSREEIQERSRDFERRLANPDWAFVASEFGGNVPGAVETLYRDQTLLGARDVRLSDHLGVAFFVPADDNAFDPEQWFNPASDAFVFAVTAFGDPFFVRTGQVTEGLPVYVYFHDGGDTETVAVSLQQFVEYLQQEQRLASTRT